MFKCYNCGHIFDDGEQSTWIERHGLEWGGESCSGCPLCDGQYGEAISCKRCGGAFLPDELVEGFCNDCIEELKDEYRFNVERCNEIFEEPNNEDINPFLLSFFSYERINDILLNKLLELKEYMAIDCKKYIDEHTEDFILGIIQKDLE